MASEEPKGTRPGPVVLRIKLRYDTVDVMVQRFAPNVGKSGLFLPTRSLQPLGAEIKFELRLANETPVLVGLGRVKAVKSPDPNNSKATFGMAIELMRVTRESRDVILRMLERRRELGLPETAIPLPADIDAARRADLVETSIRDVASGPVPALMPQHDSGKREPSEGLLTSPRRQSGPMAIVKVSSVAPLAPEPARRRRPLPAEIIEAASGPISQLHVPGLDEDVDVAAVLARARLLAGGDLDGELEALREAAAAPLEIDIEAASAELARQLGGAAVRRDRSTHWATPPAIAEAVVVPPPVVEVEPAIEPAAIVEPAVDEPAPELDLHGILAPQAAATFVDDDRERARDAAFHRRHAEDADARAGFIPAGAHEIKTDPVGLIDEREVAAPDDEEHEVDPDQIHDEIHQLSEDDFEEVEHTHIGAAQSAFDQHAFATRPFSEDEALANQLDADLAALEVAHEHDDLGIGELSGAFAHMRRESTTTVPPAELVEAELAPATLGSFENGEDFIHSFQPGVDQPDENTVLGEAEPYAAAPASYVDAHAATAYSLGDPGTYHDPNDGQVAAVEDELGDEHAEIDDFEILAEADADDADLLSAHGEAEVSDPAFALPDARPSHSDFASRLDLGDESDMYSAASDPGFYADDRGSAPHALDPKVASAGHALAGFDEPEPYVRTPAAVRPIYDDNGSSSYTLAGAPSADDADFEPRHAAFSPNRFDDSDVISIGPNVPGVRAISPSPARPADEVDLESALEALDVDLDDLSVPHKTPAPRAASQTRRPAVRATSARSVGRPSRALRDEPPVRATTEDGVLIDFEGDDDFER